VTSPVPEMTPEEREAWALVRVDETMTTPEDLANARAATIRATEARERERVKRIVEGMQVEHPEPCPACRAYGVCFKSTKRVVVREVLATITEGEE